MAILKKAPRKIWRFLDYFNRCIKKNQKQIFLYSNLGFRDNVRAVYDYLIENDYNKKFKIVCSLSDYKQYRHCAPDNVKFVGNFTGLFQFFRSKFCFYCFGKYPIKPSDKQTVINLWHGMPIKRIGNMEQGKEKTEFNYFTYLLCTSEFFREIMKESFNCSDEQIFICGQPRTDIMYNILPSGFENNSVSDLMDINGRKLLLWLPTFRNDCEYEMELMSDEILEKLDKLCEKHGWSIMIKLHPLSTAVNVRTNRHSFIKIFRQETLDKKNINLYCVLKESDCLITDYSSVYFDYLLLDRPIGFTIHDMSNYSHDRGFVFENPDEYMPGEKIKTGENLLDFAESIFSGKDKYKKERQRLCTLFNKYTDGENCRRIIEKAGIKK
ncbi:MAG: CDP-glycerol glycerophosphotransferase family protein [Oscillospiraceae bacterium]|nr:CDP-glycerol glycerophosphotransferase family protein [Oscillospiraceae bacterium]